MIRWHQVSKTYPNTKRPALSDVNLHVAAGQCLCLVGTSGSGKSTLLRMVNRLVTPDAGHIEVGATPVADLEVTALRRRIGYVIQQGGLFPHLDVAGNIALLLKLTGATAAAIRHRVSTLLDGVQLEASTAQKMPRELSGGQAQRVSIARALALDPDYLLMDEPFSALDPLTRSELWSLLAALRAKKPRTVLLVTHDMREALTLGDRIAVMDQGSVVQVGAPDELRAAPATPFVRALLQSADGGNHVSA